MNAIEELIKGLDTARGAMKKRDQMNVGKEDDNNKLNREKNEMLIRGMNNKQRIITNELSSLVCGEMFK